MNYNPMLLIDFYKAGHVFQYPPNTQTVYSTWTPRMSHIKQIDKVVVFGFQGFVKEILIDYFNHNFFNRPKSVVIEGYKRIMKNCLFDPNPNVAHIEALHDLGYLPVLIKSLDEGTLCPLRVPCLTIENTHNDFYWVN